MRSNHDNRLRERESQSRGWAAPLPDFATMPRANEAPRQRVEWATRDSINNRMWENLQVAGPKAVTSEMIASHPTNGAEDFIPSSARNDRRTWSNGLPVYFPDVQGPGERPKVPDSSLWKNPHFDDVDVENIDTAREFKSVVKEDTRFRQEDASLRMTVRTFEHQWLPTVSVEKLAAAEKLRPAQDDYRQNVKAALSQ